MKDNQNQKRINNIFDNPYLLRQLSEISVGVRKASDIEVQELNKRIHNNRKKVIFIILILVGLAFLLNMLAGVYGLILSFFFIINSFFSVNSDKLIGLKSFKDSKYLIIKCNIRNRDAQTKYSNDGISSKTELKILCKDLNNLYIDDFFPCNENTYRRCNQADIIVLKTNNGKAYINSFDRMWIDGTRIVKCN